MGGAFIAGAAAIVSPGLALLLPGYAAFIAACSLNGRSGKPSLLSTAAGFIAGFSLVFVALGASGTILGRVLVEYLPLLTSAAGIVLMLLGLSALLSIGRAPWTGGWWAGLLGAVAGLSFAFGWKPTIDPALAAILIAAAQPDSAGRGLALLSTYALGLAVPLLIVAKVIHLAVARWGRFDRAIALVSGTLIIATGVLIFNNR
jgi:cytochrome c-type biogenesis protein